MLPNFIIEKIKRREQENKVQQEYVYVYEELEEPLHRDIEKKKEEDNRGAIVIDVF